MRLLFKPEVNSTTTTKVDVKLETIGKRSPKWTCGLTLLCQVWRNLVTKCSRLYLAFDWKRRGFRAIPEKYLCMRLRLTQFWTSSVAVRATPPVDNVQQWCTSSMSRVVLLTAACVPSFNFYLPLPEKLQNIIRTTAACSTDAWHGIGPSLLESRTGAIQKSSLYCKVYIASACPPHRRKFSWVDCRHLTEICANKSGWRVNKLPHHISIKLHQIWRRLIRLDKRLTLLNIRLQLGCVMGTRSGRTGSSCFSSCFPRPLARCRWRSPTTTGEKSQRQGRQGHV